MDKLEKLINSIMKECEKNGEPVTYNEAKEMAEMELKANKDCKRYEQATKPRKKPERVRKVDTEKGQLLEYVKELLIRHNAEIVNLKTETELRFNYNGNAYTFKLTKHRTPKK